jgi:osmoprotectant transport system permease protein
VSELGPLALAHLRLVVIALGLAGGIGLFTGLVSVRRPAASRLLVGLASLVQTIPAIALLAVMVPLIAWIASTTGAPISSIGEVPALIALTAYALLPIVRGVIVGIGAIDPAIVQAARAVGMSERERSRLLDLPLAAPSILAGLRTAAVWTVGMATLATPVGATSLGNLIFGGLQTRHYGDVLAGCGAAALMAIAIDGALGWVERRARGRHAGSALPITTGALAIATIVAVASTRAPAGGARPIRIGAKSFTEQLVLAEVLRCAIGTRATVEIRPSLGTTVAFDALRAGDLDVYVEYTGTAWTTLLDRNDDADRATIQRDVGPALEREHGVQVVARLGFENAYALVVRGAMPAQRISELGSAGSVRVGGDYEFFARPEWAALRAAYGLRPLETRNMDPSLLYEALATGAVDVISGYTTDGRIEALGLRALDDDRGAIPPYDAIVLVSSRLAAERPEVIARLRALDGTIDADAMRGWNHAVDSGEATPREAALAHPLCR